MNKKFLVGICILAISNWIILPAGFNQSRVFAEQNISVSDKHLSEGEIKNIGNNIPLFFEANRGQLDKRVKFSARGAGYKLFLTSSEAVYVIPERKAEEAQNPKSEIEIPTPQTPKSRRAVAVWMKLSGANENAEAVGIDELAGKHNYFKGSDQTKWQSNVPLYQTARFNNVYQGVDLEWHSNETGSIEYDFKVSPNVSTRQIEWQIDGADKITVEADGSLTISTPFGELKQKAPVTYQETDGLRSAVESRFEQRGETSVGFTVGAYDQSKPLTIDPVTDLQYSTFLGGESADTGWAIAAGGNNSVYITGQTFSTSFPTTSGVFDETSNGAEDVFVTRLDSSGATLIYSTFIGGGSSDIGRGIAVDASGNAYITGSAVDSETPYPTTAGAPFPNHAGGEIDAFVTKLNPSGSALVYSTFIGGNGTDQGFGIAFAPGNFGGAYITGFTDSANFPTISAYDSDYNGGGGDTFITKIAANGLSLDYSTFIGGSAFDSGRGIAVDDDGNAYMTGISSSSTYPTTAGAFDTSYNGFYNDVVVTNLNANGSALVYSTFLGGNENDVAYALAIDSSRNVYITGQTESDGTIPFPTTAGAFDTTPNGHIDVFVTKLNSSGTALGYSTLLGGESVDLALAIAVNNFGNAFVTGQTSPGLTPYPTTPGAYDTTPGGTFNFDAFLTKLAPTGSALIYSTLIGGSGDEAGLGVAVNSSGNAFLTGNTTNNTIDFPTTAGVFQPNINGPSDAFVSKFAATNNALTITVVTNINNSGAGSLRQAVINANASPEDDLIQFSSLFNIPQTISLSTGQIDITSNITIQGTGANLLTVRNTAAQSATSRVFTNSGSTVLNGMTITGGNVHGDGGGIANSNGLTLNNCAVSGNFGFTGGGGIHNTGSLVVLNSTISGNTGGGILNDLSNTTITNSTVSGNSAYGIYNSFGAGDNRLFINNSTISNHLGSGIHMAYGSATLKNSIVAGNQEDIRHGAPGGSFVISGGYNLIGNRNIYTFDQPGDQSGTTAAPLNPRLAPLAFNGGTTQTHELLINSTAIDQGNRSDSVYDQRGLRRPLDIAGIINLSDGSDIGAFEYHGNKAPFDFDGDGKTDIGIFRPAVGEWWIQRSLNSQTFALQFGNSTDKIAPGDFTGDGRADIAFFRPSTGEWFVLRSENFSFYSFPFGNSQDIAAPADYDGDGITDAAIFRTTTSTWYINKSTGGNHIEQFGQSGDVPVTSDYDGDGKSDIAIYRPALGEWWINKSTAGLVAFQFGNSTDKPVPGDYTGDGKSDVVFKRATGGFNWFVLRSEDSSFYSFPFGTDTDIPAPGDFDGDGKYDAAVFRPSSANWFIQRSTAGTLIQQFGTAGDRPIPNAFVP